MQATKVVEVIKEDMIKTMKDRDGDSSQKGFTPSRSFNKVEGKKEASFLKPRGTPKEFKGKSRFTLEQIETFRKKGKCFECGLGYGHKAA